MRQSSTLTPSARSRGPLTGPRTGTTSHRGFHLWHEAPSADPPALRAGFRSAARAARRPRSRRELGSANPTPSPSWLGNRKSLRDSRFELFDCERGAVAPFHTFPPVRRAANGVRCHLFFAYGSTRVVAQRPGNTDLLVDTARRTRAEARTADQVRWGTGGGKLVPPSAKKRGDGYGTPTSGRHRAGARNQG